MSDYTSTSARQGTTHRASDSGGDRRGSSIDDMQRSSRSQRAQAADVRAGVSDGHGFPGGEHIVAPGDTLWGIARRYYTDGRRWTDIRDANPGKVHRGGDLIYVGEQLTIPADEAQGGQTAPGGETAPSAPTTGGESGQAPSTTTPGGPTGATPGAGATSGGDTEAVECLDFSTMSAADLAVFMQEVAAGTRVLDPVNRDGLLQHIETLSNDDFSSIMRTLDSGGQLFAFLQRTLQNTTEVGVEGATIETEVPVLCWRMWNADDRIDADVERANEIYNHDGIGIIPVSKREITKADAEAAAGTTLPDEWKADASTTGSGSDHTFSDAAFDKLIKAFIPTTVIGGLWVKDFTRAGLFGIAGADFYFAENYPKVAVMSGATARDDTFAHEIGHILTDAGHRDTDDAGTDDPDALMHRGSGRNTTHHGDDRLNSTEVAAIKSSIYGWAINQCVP